MIIRIKKSSDIQSLTYMSRSSASEGGVEGCDSRGRNHSWRRKMYGRGRGDESGGNEGGRYCNRRTSIENVACVRDGVEGVSDWEQEQGDAD